MKNSRSLPRVLVSLFVVVLSLGCGSPALSPGGQKVTRLPSEVVYDYSLEPDYFEINEGELTPEPLGSDFPKRAPSIKPFNPVLGQPNYPYPPGDPSASQGHRGSELGNLLTQITKDPVDKYQDSPLIVA